jgi:glycerol-3-phosphate cytidylyltransferase-like family protein
LDTRAKIVKRDEVVGRLQNRKARWISGYFDPLLAEHVERIARAREAGWALVVEVIDPPDALLEQRARAELVAALATVDFVVLGESGRAVDPDIREGFLSLVVERHRQETVR